MENGWKMEVGKWKTDSSLLCVARKPWRGSPKGDAQGYLSYKCRSPGCKPV
jgi:hypothetical protein